MGVCIKQPAVTLGQMKEIYGVLGPEEKLFYKFPSATRYMMPPFGNRKGRSDRIGVLLEFDSERRPAVSFFKNGRLLGTPYRNLRSTMYYPVVSLCNHKTAVTLKTSLGMPKEPYEIAEGLVTPVTKVFDSNSGPGDNLDDGEQE